MNQGDHAHRAADEGTIIIIAHRGPHDFVWEGGRWIAKRAVSGIISMIEPLARQPNVAWFCCVSEPPESEAERDALYTTAKDQTDPDLNVVPVPLPADVYRDYYGTISNEVLWMLQHHLVGQFGYSSLDEHRHQAWQHYLEASRRVVDAVVATGIPVRAFLLQDYHLYPLAGMLRERFPDVPSLHFIHIPFPGPAILKLLPRAWREVILRGLLGADVVGLQTPEDVRAFLASCEELLGLSVDYPDSIVALESGRRIRVKSFPGSINPDAVRSYQQSLEVASARQRLTSEFKERTIVRVDRLDPSKNQILGFTAFGRLLERNPDWIGRVRFLAVLIPSRTDITIYREYRDAVYGEIEKVNARFRDACGYDPVTVLYTNERAIALAALECSDVVLANSRQDGMNLIVKDWAIVTRRPGVLVLSETAGAAAESAGRDLLVCPFDIEGTAEALGQALAMPDDQRQASVDAFRRSVEQWTAKDWLNALLKELGLSATESAAPATLAMRRHTKTIDRFECTLTVQNQLGIHARPAAAFVRCAREFACDMEIEKDGEIFPAKSILAVLSAGLDQGTTFILRARGSDAKVAAERIRELLDQLRD
jgi:trehalose 6-phosphate synthase